MVREISEDQVNCVYDDYYFNISKKFQIYAGLWPYQSRTSKMVRRIIFYLFLIPGMIPVCSGFRKWCGVRLGECCENAMEIIFNFTVITKYWITDHSERKLKNIYYLLAKNWLEITNPDEHAILIEYARQARLFTITYMGFCAITAIGFSQVPAIPIILDAIVPLNESRPKILAVKGDFMFDPFQHYYKLYAYTTCITSIIFVTVTSIDSMYTIIVYQILGILSIVKYRLQRALSLDSLNDISYDTIIEAIYLHKEALQFIDLIEASYSYFFLTTMGLTIIFLSVGCVTLVLYAGDAIDFCRLMMVVLSGIVHLVFLTWPGQKIIDHSCDLFVSLYATKWYNISLRSRKLIIFLMLKCVKPCVLTAGGLYILNLENLKAIVSTAVTYITVLSSFR